MVKSIKIFWPSINIINSVAKDDLINKFPEVFADRIGTIKGPLIWIKLKKDAKPVFMRVRTFPFALRNSVDLELDGLMSEGIIKQIHWFLIYMNNF